MARPLASISARMSVPAAADRFATSMWLVPAYRRLGPVACGQQAISRTSKPLAAAQSATSKQRRLRERRGQEPEPHRASSTATGAAADAGPLDLHPAARRGALGDGVVDEHLVVAVGERRIRRTRRTAARRRRQRRSPGRARRTCPRSPRRGRRAGPRPPGRPGPSGPGSGAGSRSGGRDGRATGGRAVSESQADRARRAVDLPLQRVLPAGADLGHR